MSVADPARRGLPPGGGGPGEGGSSPPVAIPDWAGPSVDRPGVGACLARLEDAIVAATTLGLPTADAASVRAEAGARLRFPADTYLLALVGGTGVGKSSLLNALAGASVSEASARRPTTAEPVAWVPRAARSDVAALLEWLEVRPDDVREHDEPSLAGVAILDLPDLDSIERAHRERVEAVLPRADAVVWVTDPEKYHDAVLHDDFLRRWVPRLDRQAVVLNKVDRLTPDDAERIRRDLERDLATERAAGSRRPKVLLAAARPPERPEPAASRRPDISELRAWLTEEVEAKAVVRARLGASISAAVAALAEAAGVDPALKATAILDAADRRKAMDRTTEELLRVVDLPSVERQAVAATRARARARGAGPAGAVTSLLYRLSGRERRVADPAGFLARWRDRGSLAPSTEAIRSALAEPLGRAAPATRPVIAGSAEPARLETGLAAAVDRAVALRGRDVPTSWVWPIIGLLQTVATLVLAFATVWVVLWVFVKFPVDSVTVPVLGVVPIPFLLLAGALLVGYLIARLLGLHAGWVGRRWARSLRADVRAGVEREVESSAFAGLDRLESARRVLWSTARATASACGAH
jgi:energy-coupling factor transporter ATP-binding protein EcfA2